MTYLRNQFHTGYAVRNIDAAIAGLRDRLGIADWKILRLPESAPGRALAFAYAGNMMLELIDIRPGRMPVYDDWVPDDPTALRVHHHGYFANGAQEFDAIARHFETAGFPMVVDEQMPGILQFRYFDTVALLGHYTEFVLMQPGGETFWQDVPHN